MVVSHAHAAVIFPGHRQDHRSRGVAWRLGPELRGRSSHPGPGPAGTPGFLHRDGSAMASCGKPARWPLRSIRSRHHRPCGAHHQLLISAISSLSTGPPLRLGSPQRDRVDPFAHHHRDGERRPDQSGLGGRAPGRGARHPDSAAGGTGKRGRPGSPPWRRRGRWPSLPRPSRSSRV